MRCRAATTFSDSTEAWFNLGVALLDKSSSEDESNPDPTLKTEGIQCFQTALKRDPKNEEAMEELSLLGEDFEIDDLPIVCIDDHMKLR